jgi:AcrR family transcriptional regulator
VNTGAQPSSRQAKADDTRVRLFTAGAELFAAQGYHATSVEQIARRAGVAKGTFFLHFPTKDALVTELIRIQVRQVSREHARLVARGETATGRLRALVMLFSRASDRNMARAVLVAGLDKPDVGAAFDRLFEGILELMTTDAREAVRDGELAESTDPARFAALMMDSFLGAQLSFAMNERGRSLPEMVASVVDTNFAAFAPKPGSPKGEAT